MCAFFCDLDHEKTECCISGSDSRAVNGLISGHQLGYSWDVPSHFKVQSSATTLVVPWRELTADQIKTAATKSDLVQKGRKAMFSVVTP